MRGHAALSLACVAALACVPNLIVESASDSVADDEGSSTPTTGDSEDSTQDSQGESSAEGMSGDGDGDPDTDDGDGDGDPDTGDGDGDPGTGDGDGDEGPDIPLMQLSCWDEGDLYSIESSQEVSLSWINASGAVRRTYWLNPEGQRVFYLELPPEGQAVQQTFTGHPWVITGANDECIEIYVPGTEDVIVNLN